jgi:xanthosine utilization system XapX-like protein
MNRIASVAGCAAIISIAWGWYVGEDLHGVAQRIIFAVPMAVALDWVTEHAWRWLRG